MKQRIKLLICLFVFALGSIAQAFSSGPVPGRTGAPGEATCVDCHDSFELNRGPGRVEILDLPKTYNPGQRIRMRVSVQQQNRQRWGFQITALDSKEQPAGQFSIIDAASTQLLSDRGRSYVEHTGQGTRQGVTGGTEWVFEWIAPNQDVGPVIFYAAGNAADGSNHPLGDFIYTTVAQIGAPADPNVTLLSPNGGESISGGETFTINWNSTNATSHDLLLQLNGPGDVPKVIASGLAAEVSSFEWSVPNGFASTQARVIVVAQGQEGRADSDSSDRPFTITAGSSVAGPTVTKIIITSEKLKVVGSNFLEGSRVTVNGVGFTTVPTLKSSGSIFIQKGSTSDGRSIGKSIPRGVPVRLRFTNPDGGVTEINYTRP
ncbi:MAG: choice-of-anchor V domain-containing protein [Acidobacteriota bacterium]